MTRDTRGSLFALTFLVIGLVGTALMFILPIVSFFDWRAGGPDGITRTEAVLFGVMVGAFVIVRLGSPAVVRHGYRMKGETPPDPLPVRSPHWARTLFFCALALGAMWFS